MIHREPQARAGSLQSLDPPNPQRAMKARQAVLVEPFKVEIRDTDLPDPAPNQILVECEASAISAGTESMPTTG